MSSPTLTRRAALIGAMASSVALGLAGAAYGNRRSANLDDLIEANRAAIGNWTAAKENVAAIEQAILDDRQRRCPMAAMPGVGSAEIVTMSRYEIDRAYNEGKIAYFARRGLDGNAMKAAALRNYEAAWEAETARSVELGVYVAIGECDEAGDAVLATLRSICAFVPANKAEANTRANYLAPLLRKRSWASDIGMVADWEAVYVLALGGEV